MGVSRQTISKRETDETLPDICQSKKLADLYGVSLDKLIEYDVDEIEIQDMIDQTDDNILFLPPIKRKWIWQDTQNS
ncbi:helix-turn-helix transcriptional regulator [Erysipelotrichaceae bacterium 66-17]